MFCSIWDEMPSRNRAWRNRPGSSSVGRPSRLRRTSHHASEPRATAPTASRRPTYSPPSCQTRIPITTPPMPTADSTAPTTSTLRGPVYGTSRISFRPVRTTTITRSSSRKPTRHERKVVRKPPSSGPTAAAIAAGAGGGGGGGGAPAQRGGARLRGALKVAVDERLHRRQEQRRAEPADDGPEHDDCGEALGDRHGQGADRVAEEAQDERALASDEVADLAPDQDERGRHEGLERDGALHAAHGRVEVLDHLRDRHVHQRRVDDQHEHRHRQEHGEALPSGAPVRLLRAVPCGQGRRMAGVAARWILRVRHRGLSPSRRPATPWPPRALGSGSPWPSRARGTTARAARAAASPRR